ncbi:hypothetical protein GGX14DRAFT_391495 [Mycena pura]|uniref:Uncharacterized protein n=1 Tax=Mycena pura TaxID=153505 RepID=A0AAD6VKN1_9AGAR|nr:hypothetical protein GGX14DRAFT_391495 [Mycena pura]
MSTASGRQQGSEVLRNMGADECGEEHPQNTAKFPLGTRPGSELIGAEEAERAWPQLVRCAVPYAWCPISEDEDKRENRSGEEASSAPSGDPSSGPKPRPERGPRPWEASGSGRGAEAKTSVIQECIAKMWQSFGHMHQNKAEKSRKASESRRVERGCAAKLHERTEMKLSEAPKFTDQYRSNRLKAIGCERALVQKGLGQPHQRADGAAHKCAQTEQAGCKQTQGSEDRGWLHRARMSSRGAVGVPRSKRGDAGRVKGSEYREWLQRARMRSRSADGALGRQPEDGPGRRVNDHQLWADKSFGVPSIATGVRGCSRGHWGTAGRPRVTTSLGGVGPGDDIIDLSRSDSDAIKRARDVTQKLTRRPTPQLGKLGQRERELISRLSTLFRKPAKMTISQKSPGQTTLTLTLRTQILIMSGPTKDRERRRPRVTIPTSTQTRTRTIMEEVLLRMDRFRSDLSRLNPLVPIRTLIYKPIGGGMDCLSPLHSDGNMVHPKSTPTSKPLHEQFAPGGYLHDGTSDTQVFGFSKLQSRSAGRVPSPSLPPCPDSDVKTEFTECHRGHSQGDTADPDDPASELHLNLYQRHFAHNPIQVSPALLAYLESPAPVSESPPSSQKHSRARESSTSPPLKRQRLEAVSPTIRETGKILAPMPPETAVRDAKELRVERLAHLLSSADYANAEDADTVTGSWEASPGTRNSEGWSVQNTFPLLKKFGGIRIYEGILSPETIQKLKDDEITFIRQFYEACWQSRPPHAHRYRHIDLSADHHLIPKDLVDSVVYRPPRRPVWVPAEGGHYAL